jgi:hypothetical protein
MDVCSRSSVAGCGLDRVRAAPRSMRLVIAKLSLHPVRCVGRGAHCALSKGVRNALESRRSGERRSSPSIATAPLAAPSAASAPGPAAADTARPQGEAPAPSLDVASGLLPRDLTPWGMFMAADLVVKAVMIGLLFASVLTWTIWLAKTLELVGARRNLARAHQVPG